MKISHMPWDMMPVKNVPCDVSGKEKNNVMEPRFGYTVCEDHVDVRPVDIRKKDSK